MNEEKAAALAYMRQQQRFAQRLEIARTIAAQRGGKFSFAPAATVTIRCERCKVFHPTGQPHECVPMIEDV